MADGLIRLAFSHHESFISHYIYVYIHTYEFLWSKYHTPIKHAPNNLLTCRFSFCAKCFWQSSQVNGFSPVCARRCLRSFCSSLKFLPQNAQLNLCITLVCPCSLRQCLLNNLDSVNPILQILQWYIGIVWILPLTVLVWTYWTADIWVDSPLSLKEKQVNIYKQKF